MNSAELLDRLIGFPTVSRDSNLSLIGFVQDFLSRCGIESKLYPDSDGRKANLFASIGPAERPGILLSGHTDVVPVDGQAWSSPPFEMRQRGEQLFARGSADMKGFLACALRASQLASQQPLRQPLQLAFSYDEEVGCVGVRSLIDDMAGWSHRPRFCIVGEPTLLRSAIGHKGKVAVKVRCRGRASHSANPDRGVNAIHLAADLIARIRERQGDIAWSSAPRCRLRSAAHDPARRRHPGRHGAQHRARPLRIRVRDPQPAIGRCRRHHPGHTRRCRRRREDGCRCRHRHRFRDCCTNFQRSRPRPMPTWLRWPRS